MELKMKEIEVVAEFYRFYDHQNGDQVRIRPRRFRMREAYQSEYQVVNIDRVICQEVEGFKDNKSLLFECESDINGLISRYSIKYLLSETRWIIFKA